jgi:hypothetical protein
VADTCALIDVKFSVPLARQWSFLNGLTILVDQGRLAFPRQVQREITDAKYPDAPGAWVASCRGWSRHPEPAETVLPEVLAIAPKLVDWNSEREAADPYVIAMALEISRRHPAAQVVVATNDTVDRLPMKTSVLSACKLLGLQCWTPPQFFEWAKAEIDWQTADLDDDAG